ncbi:MAG TPA: alpha/beta hydrolase [Nocardioides sp.]|nr:alpha/beta hydrolase [Nocardioides sp.]
MDQPELATDLDSPRTPGPPALLAAFLVAGLVMNGACTGEGDGAADGPAPSSTTAPTSDEVDGLFALADGRELYLRCTGAGSPTVILEGGDDDDSSSYQFAEAQLAATTRTCVYDRANLGRSDADPRCRGLEEIVTDLEQLLSAAEVPAPYVLVGTSGGGHITVGYAVDHPEQVTGMVLVEVPPPFPDPPRWLVAETRCDAPGNVESRDFLQVERDAWDTRREVGDIPVTVISNQYGPDEVAAAPAFERALIRDNVERQQGWLVLSPDAEQVVVHTGHAVEEADPQLVVDAILDVVDAARGAGS